MRHCDFPADHMVDAVQQIVYYNLSFDPIVRTVDAALVVPRQVHYCFAQRLRGNRAGVYIGPTNDTLSLDHGDTFANLSSLNSRAMAGGTRPNHN